MPIATQSCVLATPPAPPSSTPQTAVITTTVTAAETAAAKEVPPQTLTSRRKLRCRACAGRKFRTTRDLALHILAKHGHAQLPLTAATATATTKNSKQNACVRKNIDGCDADACSVTQTSAVMAACDMRDIDQLIADVQCSGDDAVASTSTATAAVSNAGAIAGLRRTGAGHTVAKRMRRAHTASSHVLQARASDTQATAVRRRRRRACVANAAVSKRTGKRKGEGESISPVAQDVYLRRFREGSIQLVPIPQQPTETINFAQGLF